MRANPAKAMLLQRFADWRMALAGMEISVGGAKLFKWLPLRA
jgi:hypothetical protein